MLVGFTDNIDPVTINTAGSPPDHSPDIAATLNRLHCNNASCHARPSMPTAAAETSRSFGTDLLLLRSNHSYSDRSPNCPADSTHFDHILTLPHHNAKVTMAAAMKHPELHLRAYRPAPWLCP